MTTVPTKKTVRKVVNRWQLYLMLLPAVAAVVIFSYIPMTGIVIALKKYNLRDGIWGSPWAGLDQFVRFFNSLNIVKIIKLC